MRRVLATVATATVFAMFWKELPALRRYLKIRRM
jgi:hypothetical protein